jgi:hypothetical protein
VVALWAISSCALDASSATPSTKAPSLHRRYPASGEASPPRSVLRASTPPRPARIVPRGHPVGEPSPPIGASRVALLSCADMPSPLPRRDRERGCRSCWHASQLDSRSRWQPSPQYRRVGSRIGFFEACSAFTHVTACPLARSPEVILSSKTPTASLPPPPLRLLPAGTTPCRAGLTPAEEQRLCTAYGTADPTRLSPSVHLCPLGLPRGRSASKRRAMQPIRISGSGDAGYRETFP